MPLGGLQPASPNASLVECHGHSLTNGGGLVDPTDRVSAKLAGFLGSAQEVNRSIAGACAGAADNIPGKFGGHAWTLQRVQREFRLRQPYEPGSNVVVLQYGLNDMWNIATTGSPWVPTTQGLNVFKHSMRTIICRFRCAMFAESYYGASYVSYASVNGGTWTSTAQPGQVGGIKGSGAISSGTHYHKLTGTNTQKNGSVITIPLPGDYPGSAVCPLHVQFVADPLLTAGTITSGGTGVAVKVLTLDATATTDTVSTPTSTNVLTLRFTGSDIPASGGVPRNLTLTVGGTSTAGFVGFDGWGIEAKAAPIIYVLQITKSNGAAGAFGGITDTHLGTWNTALSALVDEFRGTGGSNSGADFYTEYVELDSVIGGAGWNGNAATITDNPLSSGATTINITGAGAAALTSPVMIDSEVITFTANSGTQLTGCVRGAWASTAAAHNLSSAVRLVNLAALENFSADGIHWAEGAQKQVASKIWRDSLSRFVNDVTANSDRVGPGRVDARQKLGSSVSQLIPTNAITPIKFNLQDYDTVSAHDPAGDGVFSRINSQVSILSDGQYTVNATMPFDYTKAGQGVNNENGIRHVTLRKNGSGAMVTAGGRPFGTSVLVPWPVGLTWQGELRNGEYLELCAIQTGAGVSTAVTTSNVPNSGGSGVTINVTSTTGFFVNDIIRIDDEHLLVTGVPNGTQLTVTRAQQGWPFAAHLIGAGVHSGINILGSTWPWNMTIKLDQRL